MADSDDKYWNQGIAALEKNHALLMEIVGSFPAKLQTQVKKMFDGPMGEQFLSAPASTRKSFHYAFPGGLLAHSLTVVRHAVVLAETLAPGRWPAWKVMLCALFHDFGKAGSAGKPYYVQNTERWKRERGEYYDVSQDEWMTTTAKGLFTLQQQGVEIDAETYLAISLADGMGPVENKPYSFREPPLALITHWADHWATVMEKEELR